MNDRRRSRRAQVLAMLVVSMVASTVAWRADASEPSIGIEEAAFWQGAHVERAQVFWEACGIQGPCFDHVFDVAEQGPRLRVALTYPDISDAWAFTLYDPDGTLLPLTWDPLSMPLDEQAQASLYESRRSFELYVASPAPGRWRARVIPLDVTDSSYRLRVKLEGVRPPLAPPVVLAPNLRAEPPSDLTFAAPASMGVPGVSPAHHRQVNADGRKPISCTPREITDGARRCLRMTLGIENVGDGRFDVRFGGASSRSGEAVQRLYSSDGSFTERPAGTYVFHDAHMHYHYSGVASFTLHRVMNRGRGPTVPAGASRKIGWCPAHSALVDFDVFDQDVPVAGDCSSPAEPWIGLSRGWVDLYGWMLNDNYVEFGDNPSGRYVVRAVVDPADLIVESNEQDNASYAYVRVKGGEVEVLERGYGSDPWDPAKRVIP